MDGKLHVTQFLFQEVNDSWDAEEEIVESWEDIEVYIIFQLQGYPKRMRLQRRFYGKYSVYFHMFRILCNELDSIVAMTKKIGYKMTKFKAEDII